MSKWNYISIKDGEIVGALPDYGKDCIITTNDDRIETDVFEWDPDDIGYFRVTPWENVRAWMPLPEPASPVGERSHILRAVGRYIQTQAEENGLRALGVNGIVYNVEDVLQELDALIREEEGET